MELSLKDINSKIYTIRDTKVMLDSDLAKLYQVETRNLNKAVSRNLKRFPSDFMFEITKEEFENLKFQNGTSSWEEEESYQKFSQSKVLLCFHRYLEVI